MSGKVSSQVIDPYAEALMSLGKERNLTVEFSESLRELASLWENSPELSSFLESPLIKAEGKKAVLGQILGDSNVYLKNFMMLLVDRGRIMFLDKIAEKYLELFRKLNNVVLAEVTSATTMSEGQLQAVKDKITSLSGATAVEVKTTVEPDLIGGVIIKVGSQVYDTSIRGQLRRLALNLSKG
ncbi:MAG: F0F1 ATP synthase subunit delta [Gloeocapsa sp. DLM2.Bin57]|nr:MAG: F0F1 ATP synthase subunit delta [Gloeocapsa sp. DLM2.Bin57]